MDQKEIGIIISKYFYEIYEFNKLLGSQRISIFDFIYKVNYNCRSVLELGKLVKFLLAIDDPFGCEKVTNFLYK